MSSESKSIARQLTEELSNLEESEKLNYLKLRLKTVDREYKQEVEDLVGVFGQVPNLLEKKYIVILTHGIRTRGVWTVKRTKDLKEISNVSEVLLAGYGYFNIFSFLFPYISISKPLNKVHREIISTIGRYRDHELVIICHSFGTFLVSTILSDFPDIRVHKLILNGAIIPKEYRWDKLPNFPAGGVLNQVGVKDIWPIVAKFISSKYGDTGTTSFQSVLIHETSHDASHSTLINDEMTVKNYWKPFIENDEVIPAINSSDSEKQSGVLGKLIDFYKWFLMFLSSISGSVRFILFLVITLFLLKEIFILEWFQNGLNRLHSHLTNI